MTIKQALTWATDKLAAQKIPTSGLDAEVLLSFVIKKPKEFLYVHPEFNLTANQLKKFNQLIARRIKGEPVAYLRNLKEFYGLEFYVDKNVLIPRPETELLVDGILKIYRPTDLPTYRPTDLKTVADLGTGSGCIAIALKKYRPQIKMHAADISAQALKIARKNAKKHKVKIEFHQGHLLLPLKNKKIDILLANLPYGDKSAWSKIKNPDTAGLKFEPKVALYAKNSGLGLYEELFKQIARLRPSTRLGATARQANRESPPKMILIEIDPSQAKRVGALVKKFLPDYSLEIKKDLSGRKRLLIISKS